MNFAYQLIDEVIKKAGPRKAGSQAEHKAQGIIMEHLAAMGAKVEKEPFKAATTAKFQALKIFCLLFWTSLPLYWFALEWGFFISFINGIIFYFTFINYRNWLDFFWPKKESSNVIGTIEPLEEATSTLIFSGHIDSTPEFIWWYRFGNFGGRMTVISGFLFLAYPIFLWINVLLGFMGEDLGLPMHLTWGLFAVLSPCTLAFFFIHGKRVVEGAQDNLSGISTALQTFRELQDNGNSILKNTRIKMISFGAEEGGLKGSTAYAKRHYDEIREENAFLVNLDGILEKDHFNIVRMEPSAMVKYHEPLIEALEQSFKEDEIPTNRAVLPIGATDAASFARRGLPAVTILALGLKGLHPTYHTRRDTIEHIDPECLQMAVNVLVRFAKEWDATYQPAPHHVS